MMYYIELWYAKNHPLFIFGCCNVIAALVFLSLTRLSALTIRGANAWYKPFKFALSIAIFSWTMGWYTYELHAPETVSIFNGIVIILLGFEVIYIALQAGRGLLSHYNFSSPVYSFLAAMMGIAAAIVTFWTGYIDLLIFTTDFKTLPHHYVLNIRMGIILFVLFAFQGASMGAKSTHTVGGAEGGPALPVLNWSTKYGNLRIAHFVGMHALQVLPLLSWYVLKNTLATTIAGLLYGCLAVFSLARALKGSPLIKYKKIEIAP